MRAHVRTPRQWSASHASLASPVSAPFRARTPLPAPSFLDLPFAFLAFRKTSDRPYAAASKMNRVFWTLLFLTSSLFPTCLFLSPLPPALPRPSALLSFRTARQSVPARAFRRASTHVQPTHQYEAREDGTRARQTARAKGRCRQVAKCSEKISEKEKHPIATHLGAGNNHRNLCTATPSPNRDARLLPLEKCAGKRTSPLSSISENVPGKCNFLPRSLACLGPFPPLPVPHHPPCPPPRSRRAPSPRAPSSAPARSARAVRARLRQNPLAIANRVVFFLQRTRVHRRPLARDPGWLSASRPAGPWPTSRAPRSSSRSALSATCQSSRTSTSRSGPLAVSTSSSSSSGTARPSRAWPSSASSSRSRSTTTRASRGHARATSVSQRPIGSDWMSQGGAAARDRLLRVRRGRALASDATGLGGQGNPEVGGSLRAGLFWPWGGRPGLVAGSVASDRRLSLTRFPFHVCAASPSTTTLTTRRAVLAATCGARASRPPLVFPAGTAPLFLFPSPPPLPPPPSPRSRPRSLAGCRCGVAPAAACSARRSSDPAASHPPRRVKQNYGPDTSLERSRQRGWRERIGG